jgi:single-strand DNA-binding protein
MSAPITLTGRLVADPELKFGATGIAILKARVVTSGRKKTDSGWEDVDTTWWTVTAWRQLAENVAESLSKGDEVIVVGKVKQREYETAEGEKRSITEVTADAIGPNLRSATARTNRISRSQNTDGFQAYKAAKEDVWSVEIPEGEAPF